MRCRMKFDVSLYLVTDSLHSTQGNVQKFLNIIEQAVKGGATLVQLRDKNLSYSEIKELGKAVLKVLHPYHVPLVVNDHVQVAQEIGAAGVHVGANDMPVAEVRRMLGSSFIVGLSLENESDFCSEKIFGANYIAASPVFHTNTKPDIATPLGLEGLKKLRYLSILPLVAIGGMRRENLESVLNTGANGVAAVSAIFHAPSPFQAAQSFISEIQKYKKQKKEQQ